MMARRKRRRRIVVKQRARVRKKSERKDTLQRMEAQMPRNNGATIKVRLRKRNND